MDIFIQIFRFKIYFLEKELLGVKLARFVKELMPYNGHMHWYVWFQLKDNFYKLLMLKYFLLALGIEPAASAATNIALDRWTTFLFLTKK